MALYRLYDPNTVKRIETFSFMRLVLLSCVLSTTIFLKQDVLGQSTLLQMYAALGITFFLTLMHTVFWEETLKVKYFIASQLIYDLLLISYLIFLTGINESIFLFLYLLNIVMTSLVYQMYGALFVAFLSGGVYAGIFYVNKDISNPLEIYNLLYVELFFLLTALLCGQLMDELKKQATLLVAQKASIARLEQINDKLLNNMPVGIMLIDQNDYVKTVNQTAQSILGHNLNPDILYKFEDLLPPLAGIRTRWEKLTETEKLRFGFQLDRGDNYKQNLSFQMVTLQEPEELKESLIFLFNDITKIKELEQRLEVESRLSAVGQLAAGIAHEIRNPLASISGSIEMLKASESSKNEEEKKLITIALRETQRLNRLITDFLQFARPKVHNPEPLQLRAVIQEVVDAIQSRISDMVKTEIKVRVDPDLRILGDNERIKQVFFNLFINAVEAATGRDVMIQVDASIERNVVEILVSDNGPGIPNEVAAKVFDPFFTTKATGSGLGLATVAQIIQSHSGNIRLASNSQTGATFEILFPRISESSSSGAA